MMQDNESALLTFMDDGGEQIESASRCGNAIAR